MDFFGPFLVKERRCRVKRWGVLFCCMYSRAVHIETACELSTDCFISTLRRFKAIRGPTRLLRCDKGTNFVGMLSEFERAAGQINDDAVRAYLVKEGCDFEVKFTAATASHQGGAWERLIGQVKRVLLGISKQHPDVLTDELLRTFLAEAAVIVNQCPLTVNALGDPLSPTPLSLADLLNLKLTPLLPPPGQFTQKDVYCRKTWRRLQYLIELFWKRFKSDYLQTLQARQKWKHPSRGVVPGDVIVYREDNAIRNKWLLCRVISVQPSADGLIRRVRLQVATSQLDDTGKRLEKPLLLERPIQKLVVLVEASPEPSPDV